FCSTPTRPSRRARRSAKRRSELPNEPAVQRVVALSGIGEGELDSEARRRSRKRPHVEPGNDVDLRLSAQRPRVALAPARLAERRDLDQWCEPTEGPVADSTTGAERLLSLALDVRIEVPLVCELREEVEVSERDARCEEGLDGCLAAQSAALGARRELEVEAGGDERLVLDGFEQQELVLELDVAGPTSRRALPRIGEDRGHLQLDLPAR